MHSYIVYFPFAFWVLVDYWVDSSYTELA